MQSAILYLRKMENTHRVSDTFHMSIRNRNHIIFPHILMLVYIKTEIFSKVLQNQFGISIRIRDTYLRLLSFLT